MLTITVTMTLPDADLDSGWDGDIAELEASVRARLEAGIYGDDGGEYLPTVTNVDAGSA